MNRTIPGIFLINICYQTINKTEIALDFKICLIEDLGLITQEIGLLLHMKILLQRDHEDHDYFNRESKRTASPFSQRYSTNIAETNKRVSTVHIHAKRRNGNA